MKKLKDVVKKLKVSENVQKVMQAKTTELRNDHENLETTLTRFREDVTSFRTEVFNTIRGTKDDLQE